MYVSDISFSLFRYTQVKFCMICIYIYSIMRVHSVFIEHSVYTVFLFCSN